MTASASTARHWKRPFVPYGCLWTRRLVAKETMPNVKNRIASFEAHNEELRSLHSPLSSAGSPPVVSPASQEPYVESPERPPSTTLQAAQSRRSRLQREQWGQADEARTTQPSYKGSALMNHHRKKTEKSNGRRSPVNKATELSQRHLTMQPKPRGGEPANAREASPPPPVVKEPVRSGRMNKIQRIKNMRIERQRTPVPKSEPPQVNQSSSADHANDDDITLTSVRQIVGSDKEAASKKEDRPLDRVHRQWIEQGEEKSDKAMGRRGIVMARSSSSDYETDTSRGPAGLAEQVLKGEPSMSASQITPDVSVFFDGRRSRNEPNKDDDTYDYSGRDVEEANQRSNGLRTFESAKSQDDDSQGSVSYSQKRERAKEEQARKKAAAAAKAGMVNPFMQKEDMEHYRKQMDTPTVKTAAGVAAAATVGCIVLGPVGLLVGAAAVGIGMGVMQIPEEQRSNMRDKATEALKNAQEQAINATESLSNSCAAHYQNSGMDEHVPPEMKTCCTAIDNEVSKVTSGALGVDEEDEEGNGEAGNVEGTAPQGPKTKERIRGSSPHRFSKKKDKVACLRQGQIIPVSQIHALDPAAQPRAWLDVLASAKTSYEEKTEAMEEILILAKDKQRARIFLEEGILDSIMWTIGRYLEKTESGNGEDAWANPEVSRQEASAAKLAATCCLTLGKSHCAAIHTGGDLLLMSMYERGTVPEERQLAQMLHEVPYHVRITKTEDPTVVDPSKETFALKQMSLPQAEELAQKIKVVADGRL